MNKVTKYILGFIAIFIAAVICVFGIVKYEESRSNTTTNDSQNLGSTNGTETSKDTTIIIDKLASVTDVDALKNELNLSDDVANILKTYAPTVSYAVDNDNIYVRRGGYSNNPSDLLGVYKVNGGKLDSIGGSLSDVDNKNLDWKNINIKNSEHNMAEAKKIIDKYFFVKSNGQKLSGIGIFAYLADPINKVDPGNNMMITNFIVMPLAQVVDIYNTAESDTYNEKDVRLDVASLKDMKYREVDDSYTGNEAKYKDSIQMGELVFFAKDKVYVTAIGGIGGASVTQPAPQSSWTTDGDRVIVPIVGPGNSSAGSMVLRLNNKEYEGGQARSKYYIESVSK